jgi:hypothetical protein
MTSEQIREAATPEQIWPVRGFAPGRYMCECRSCGGRFMGDKRAYECAQCVLEAEVLRLREQAAFRDEADTLMAHSRNAELDALRAEVVAKNAALCEAKHGLEWAQIHLREKADTTSFSVDQALISVNAALRAKLAEGE